MSVNTSHLVPALDAEGKRLKDPQGKDAWIEVHGLHPDQEEPAPVEGGGRRKRRPGEEPDLESDDVLAAKLAEARAAATTAEREKKAAQDAAEALRAQQERLLAVMKECGVDETMIAEAQEKLDEAKRKAEGKAAKPSRNDRATGHA